MRMRPPVPAAAAAAPRRPFCSRTPRCTSATLPGPVRRDASASRYAHTLEACWGVQQMHLWIHDIPLQLCLEAALWSLWCCKGGYKHWYDGLCCNTLLPELNLSWYRPMKKKQLLQGTESKVGHQFSGHTNGCKVFLGGSSLSFQCSPQL